MFVALAAAPARSWPVEFVARDEPLIERFDNDFRHFGYAASLTSLKMNLLRVFDATCRREGTSISQ